MCVDYYKYNGEKMKILRKLSAGLLALAMIIPMMTSAVSAARFYAGQKISIGKIKTTSSREITAGLTYDEASLTDNEDNNQFFRMLTFNPKSRNLAPRVYSK